MKKDNMIDKKFREIEENADKALLVNPDTRKDFIMLQRKRKAAKEMEIQMRKGLHMYG